MAYVTLVAMLALVQFVYFGFAVGRARSRHDVAAPSVSGDEQFERFFRAHQNTQEQLVVFVPAVFAAGYFANALLAVGCGVVYLVARTWYFRAYIADPARRGPGMVLTLAANAVLVIAAVVGSTRSILTP